MRSVVVLPQPEEPRSEKNWPPGMRRLIPSTARATPKALNRFTSSTSPPLTSSPAIANAWTSYRIRLQSSGRLDFQAAHAADDRAMSPLGALAARQEPEQEIGDAE